MRLLCLGLVEEGLVLRRLPKKHDAIIARQIVAGEWRVCYELDLHPSD